MPKIKKLLMLIMLSMFSINSATAQQEKAHKPSLNRNSIYGTIGTGVYFYTATGYYERLIRQKSKNSSFIKVGLGGQLFWNSKFLLVQYGIITGQNKHHFELGAGVSFYSKHSGLKGTLPINATLGWRIQNPGGNSLFRMGIAWPEAVFIGIGLAF